jgi:hypothetical protein
VNSRDVEIASLLIRQYGREKAIQFLEYVSNNHDGIMAALVQLPATGKVPARMKDPLAS